MIFCQVPLCRAVLGFAMLFVVVGVLSASSQDIEFDSTSLIFHYHGNYAHYYDIGTYLSALGDVNGDGYDDIAVSSNDPYGTMIFFGSDLPDTTPDMFLIGQRATAADLTGDGIDDLVTVAIYNQNISPFGVLYFFRGYGDSLASQPYDSLRIDDDNFGFGTAIRAGYVDSDSLADLLVLQRHTLGGPTFYYYSGCPAIDTIPEWTFKIDDYSHYIGWPYPMGFIDFDGDSIKDIYVGLTFNNDPDSVSAVHIFKGPDFGQNPDFVIGAPADLDSLVPSGFLNHRGSALGDVDGDGWEDLGVTHSNRPLVYRCGPGADTLDDYRLGGDAKRMAAAGDVNGDGYNDLICGRTRTFEGAVDIYLGGDDWDTLPDLSIDRLDLPRTFIYSLGYVIGTAGDFNGDGCDDFMFSAMSQSWEKFGDAYVIRGGSWLATDVEIDPATSATIPSDPFRLRCYPNPFNSSVTVEFDLQRRELVSLTIYNVLGQIVVSLSDGAELGRGTHEFLWSDSFESNHYPSGVYFVRLVGATSSTHRKILLLR